MTPGPEPAVLLRPLQVADAGDVLALERRNHEYWRASGPRRDDEWFTLERQRSRIAAEADDRAAGRAMSFGVFLDDRLVGRLGLSSIVRGAFRNAYLGYAIDERHAGRGTGSAAVRRAVQIAWSEGLHRVQAAVSPTNVPSRRVLAKVGFRHEGLALRYLLLDGRWTDHELWAITVEDGPPTPGSV